MAGIPPGVAGAAGAGVLGAEGFCPDPDCALGRELDDEDLLEDDELLECLRFGSGVPEGCGLGGGVTRDIRYLVSLLWKLSLLILHARSVRSDLGLPVGLTLGRGRGTATAAGLAAVVLIIGFGQQGLVGGGI